MKIKHTVFTAVIAIILAALSNTLMATFTKIAEEHELSSALIIFWRSLWALLFLFPFLVFKNRDKTLIDKLKPKHFGLIFIRSIAGFCGVYLFFYCVQKLTLAVAIVLFFTSTLFMPLVAYTWKRVKISHWTWAGLAVGFAGVLLVIKPGHSLFNPASLLGILSGAFIAIGQFAVHVASEEEPSDRINFYYFLIVGLLGFLLTFFSFKKDWEEFNWFALFIMFLVGAFGLLYLFFLNYGLKHASPPLVSGFLYTSVIFAMIVDWIVWRTLIDWLTLCGVILIVIGVLLKYYYLYRKHGKKG